MVVVEIAECASLRSRGEKAVIDLAFLSKFSDPGFQSSLLIQYGQPVGIHLAKFTVGGSVCVLSV